MKMRFALWATLFALIGCSSKPPSGNPAMQSEALLKERAGMMFLAVTDKKNSVQECLIIGLRANSAFASFGFGKISDSALEQVLRENSPDSELNSLQLTKWKETRKPESVAEHTFESCLAKVKVNISEEFKKISYSCFSYAGIAANAEALKAATFERDRAVDEIYAGYGGKVSKTVILETVRSVYERGGLENEMRVHRELYAKCIEFMNQG